MQPKKSARPSAGHSLLRRFPPPPASPRSDPQFHHRPARTCSPPARTHCPLSPLAWPGEHDVMLGRKNKHILDAFEAVQVQHSRPRPARILGVFPFKQHPRQGHIQKPPGTTRLRRRRPARWMRWRAVCRICKKPSWKSPPRPHPPLPVTRFGGLRKARRSNRQYHRNAHCMNAPHGRLRPGIIPSPA